MEYKIIIKGEIDYPKIEYNEENKERYLTINELKKILPLEIEDEFVEYYDGKIKGLVEGYTHFELNEDSKQFFAVCEYTSKRELSEQELLELGEYTQGQWSDGIGEGFEQYPCAELYNCEIYISPWRYGQELIISQIKKQKNDN